MDKIDLTDKQLLELTKLIKVISESVKDYMESEPISQVNNDMSIYAMQVLSLMCGLGRGYTKDKIEQIWQMSNKLSNRLHMSSKGDIADSIFQSFVGSQYKN